MMRRRKRIHVKRDLPSQTIVTHVTFILSHFLPKWFLQSRVADVRRFLIKGLQKAINPTNSPAIVISGSVSDDVNIPDVRNRNYRRPDETDRRYDMDILYMLEVSAGYSDDDDDADYVIDSSRTYPGHFRLREKHAPPGEYLDLSDVHNQFAEDIRRTLSEEHSQPETSFKRSGPAVTEESDVLGFDYVLTGRCLNWPPEALSFFVRPTTSGWPSAELKAEIYAGGCHFVRKAHPFSSAPAAQYRFSFIMAEKKLLASLSDAQKQCYVIFKTLVKQTVEPYSAISSYCLKTTLFWTLERIPKIIWDDPIHGLASGFFGLLDMLIHFLAGWRIPQYFIPESDLVVHVPPEHIRGCLRRLVALRQRPLEELVRFDSQYEFEGMAQEPLCFGLHPTMREASIFSCRQTTIGQCLALHFADTGRMLAKSCIRRRIAATLGHMTRLQQYELLTDSPITPLLIYLDQEIDFIVSRHPTDVDNLPFLAVLSSVVYLRQLDGPPTVNRALSVLAVYEKVLAKWPADCLTHLYRGMLLLHCHRSSEAIDSLRKALAHDDSDDELVSEYLNEVKDTLDDILRMLLSMNAVIVVTCRGLCYHLLIDEHTRLGQAEEAGRLLDEFENCHIPSSPYCTYVNRPLLAFACLRLGRYRKAAAVFDADTTCTGRLRATSAHYADVCRIMDILSQLLPTSRNQSTEKGNVTVENTP